MGGDGRPPAAGSGPKLPAAPPSPRRGTRNTSARSIARSPRRRSLSLSFFLSPFRSKLSLSLSLLTPLPLRPASSQGRGAQRSSPSGVPATRRRRAPPRPRPGLRSKSASPAPGKRSPPATKPGCFLPEARARLSILNTEQLGTRAGVLQLPAPRQPGQQRLGARARTLEAPRLSPGALPKKASERKAEGPKEVHLLQALAVQARAQALPGVRRDVKEVREVQNNGRMRRRQALHHRL